MTALDTFHPAVRAWFARRFDAPTDAQLAGWRAIGEGRDALIAAPTGSGKTLTAFLFSIDSLMKRGLGEHADAMPEGIDVVYVSPLKALSGDIQRNLDEPLAGIREVAREMGIATPEIRTALRTGDTTQAARAAILRHPPHILITTPESLYLMLTADRSRALLRNVRTVIVDELHALMRDKRGSHLMLSLARLDALVLGAGLEPGGSEAGSPTLEAGPGGAAGSIEMSANHAKGREGLAGGDARATLLGSGTVGRDEMLGGGSDDPTSNIQHPTSSRRRRPLRIGLSATVHPIEEAARFLVGSDRIDADGTPACTIVNVGHRRDLDLKIEVPPSDLEAVATHEQWSDIYDSIAAQIAQHRTTLVFVNTRRMAERVAHNLGERIGEEHVAAHHGSLSKDRRLRLEQRLKNGEMRAIVATASLELGIDVGTVDLVCQIGSPRAITTFLQRIGRSGHALGLTSRGRLFATSRDELVECASLVRAVHDGRLDRVEPPAAPLDILAQQIVAEVACAEWTEDAMFDLVRGATPYASLTRADYDDVIEMLSEGAAPRVGRARALLHRDRIARTLRGRRSARLTALTCGGAIPEVADYRVVLDPDETFIGTVNEDWAIESMAGDVFLLGSHSWKIRRVESARGVLRVEDAQGRPPSVPFWLGEAPGRTWELSEEVSRLRRDVAGLLGESAAQDVAEAGSRTLEAGSGTPTSNIQHLTSTCGLDGNAAAQLADYIGAEAAALGVVPSDTDVVFERFFDDAGGMQLVVHAPFGARVNRGFGLALRKRFCVNFDFELQAAATDDAVVLSMGPQHSFPLEDAFTFVRASVLRESLEQALLVSPMFGARWRWNATRALQVLRSNAGKRVPPPIQRMRSDDLLAAVFPEQVGCQENITGPLDIPDHPLTRQTVNDCLFEAMDLVRLTDVIEKMERGEIRLHARDTTEPSPFAHEILNAKPYAFLDDAPLEERRTRAVSLRRTLPASQRDLGQLDSDAIARVRDEARPEPRDADELHDVLLGLVATPAPFGASFPSGVDASDALVAAGRAARVATGAGELWFATEQLRSIEVLYAGSHIAPAIALPAHLDGAAPEREDAVLAAVRGHMEYLGPATAVELAALLALGAAEVTSALARLEGEGIVLRGRFTPGADAGTEEWCDRRLLARIHRYTLDRLRSEIEPVTTQDFMRYLFSRQHVAGNRRLEGKRGLVEAIAQLQGFELAAAAWERDVLPSRVVNYNPQWLDDLCLAGEAAWARMSLRKSNGTASGRGSSPQRATPIALALRRDLSWLLDAARGDAQPEEPSAGAAAATLDALREHGALFFDDLAAASRQLPAQLEEALWDLVARGVVTGDGFQSLRQIMTPTGPSRSRSARRHARYGSSRVSRSTTPQGRWSIVHRFAAPPPVDEVAERVAMQLLARYGVIFRDLLVRETLGVPWREVLRALRRQEARGVVRGGRFVAGFIGEQYALPEAVEALRRVRREERTCEIIRVNAADPLNLAGIITPGPRVPAVHTNAVIYRDGLPISSEEGKGVVVFGGETREAGGEIDRERDAHSAVEGVSP